MLLLVLCGIVGILNVIGGNKTSHFISLGHAITNFFCIDKRRAPAKIVYDGAC